MANPQRRPQSIAPQPPLNFRAPKETCELLRKKYELCSHAGMLLSRYAAPTSYNAKDEADWSKQVCRILYSRSSEWSQVIQASFERWKARIEGIEGNAWWRMSAINPVIVGMGAKGALEVGLTLHHTTGLPYIPGSALKGLCRVYALFLIAAGLQVPLLQGEELQQYYARVGKDSKTPLERLEVLLGLSHNMDRKDTFEALQQARREGLRIVSETAPDILLADIDQHPYSAAFAHIFGSPDQGGFGIFHDAILIPSGNRRLLEMEVMTPHYKEYYDSVQHEGGSNRPIPPANDQRITPIQFPVVPAGSQFVFSVGVRLAHSAMRDDIQLARNWLKEALSDLGIGAKTSSGYGHFEPIE